MKLVRKRIWECAEVRRSVLDFREMIAKPVKAMWRSEMNDEKGLIFLIYRVFPSTMAQEAGRPFFKRLSSSMQVVCKPRRLEGQAEADGQQAEMRADQEGCGAV